MKSQGLHKPFFAEGWTDDDLKTRQVKFLELQDGPLLVINGVLGPL